MSKAFTPRKLLSDEFVEELWSYLPLTVFCDCEDEWSDDAEAFVTPDSCQCERKTIVCVRNALAKVLGEPQVPYTDGERDTPPGDKASPSGRRAATGEPTLHRATLTLCSLCLGGAGGECHTPGCALWMNRAPDVPVRSSVAGDGR